MKGGQNGILFCFYLLLQQSVFVLFKFSQNKNERNNAEKLAKELGEGVNVRNWGKKQTAGDGERLCKVFHEKLTKS